MFVNKLINIDYIIQTKFENINRRKRERVDAIKTFIMNFTTPCSTRFSVPIYEYIQTAIMHLMLA
jgi:hypothetical protein